MAEGHGAAGDKDGRGRRRHKRCLAEGADWQDAFKHLLRAATLSSFIDALQKSSTRQNKIIRVSCIAVSFRVIVAKKHYQIIKIPLFQSVAFFLTSN